MITKITNIRNMGVFDVFDWDANIRDAKGNVDHFKDVNLIYGRNYSGKTTLSRIVAALETGVLPERFNNPSFLVESNTAGKIDQNRLSNHPLTVRVFNKDFVKRNLSFIVDEESDIEPFAVLGEENTKIEEEIKRHVTALGSEEDKTGLLGGLAQARQKASEASSAVTQADNTLKAKLGEKATGKTTGIKYNSRIGDPSYDIRKLTAHLEAVNGSGYSHLTPEKVVELQAVLDENAKTTLREEGHFSLSFTALATKAKEVCERSVISSERIQELVDDNALALWVRAGIAHHQDKRATCAFCGGNIHPDLWIRLAKHFNKESEALRADINTLLSAITSEKKCASKLLPFDVSLFYSPHQGELSLLESSYLDAENAYGEAIDNLANQVGQRLNDIFTPMAWTDVTTPVDKLESVRAKYNELVKKNNMFTSSLNKKKEDAKELLRLNEIKRFSTDIDYMGTNKEIATLKEGSESANIVLNGAQQRVTEVQALIVKLQAELKDERKGADRVNYYLSHYFGHESLSLQAIESAEGTRFEIMRAENRAYHLSEGECSLIGFCYFIAKLEAVGTAGNNPIIWIDDPISSLDANHIFYVFSLIESMVVQRYPYRQLFVSTHNMEFLGHLLHLQLKDEKGIKKSLQHLFVERKGNRSSLIPMPSYMRDHVTEFNYLFYQIYKTAYADEGNTENYSLFCQFGNNARKFVEAILSFKYPDKDSKFERLKSFVGDDPLGASLLNRISNEYSHMKKRLERSLAILDVPETKKVARYLLKCIQNNDAQQYNSLLKSVGVPHITDDEK